MNPGPLLALFTRSLRLDAREKGTYALRAGLVGLLGLDLFFTANTLGFVGAPGRTFFSSIIYLNLVFLSLAGLSYFAGAITEEKEEMTLGLLRMSDLGAMSILLGKATSRLCGALLLILAQVPFTLLAVTLGGISVAQVLAAYATLLAYLVLLNNLALFCSVVCPRTRRAAQMTGLLLAGFLFGPPWVTGWLTWLERFGVLDKGGVFGRVVRAVCQGVGAASPFSRLETVLGVGAAQIAPGSFQVWSNLALGAGFFALAVLAFNRFTREQSEASPSRGFLTRGGKGPLRRLGLTAGRAWTGPAALRWKDMHFLGGGRAGMFGKFLLLGGLAFYTYLQTADSTATGRPRWLEEFGFGVLVMMTVILAAELAFDAGRIFRHEQRWRTLSSLALLPISTARLAYEKIFAALLSKWPTLFWIAVGACLSVSQWTKPLTERSGEPWFILCYLTAIVIFVLHLTAYLSLRLKWGALLVALGVTWLGNMLGLMVFTLMFRSRGGSEIVLLPALFQLGLSAWLHVLVGGRLRRGAAED